MIGSEGLNLFILRVASYPFIMGMRRSIITTSILGLFVHISTVLA